MPKIIFTADPKLPIDIKHLGYKKGDIVDLAADQCERWIRRNVAEPYTAPAKPPAPAARTAAKAPSPKQAEIDPTTAPIADVLEFLAKHNITAGPDLPEAKARDAALEIVTRS